MNWPLMWTATHARIVAALEAELDAERLRARRRVRRAAKSAPKPTPKAVRPVPPPHGLRAVQAALQEQDGAEEGVAVLELPADVAEAIEARAGTLTSRTAGRMIAAAVKALEAGQDAESVAAWMWRGEGDS